MDVVALAFVLEGARPLLTWVHATGNQSQHFRRIVLEPGKGVAGGVYRTGRTMVMQDVHKELAEDRLVDHPILIAEEIVSMMAIPLWQDEQVKGVLLLASRKADRITENIYTEVMHELTGDFFDYEVRNMLFAQALRVGEEYKAEALPVYELMRFPVLQAREDERGRIARDLHDSVVQSILGVQMLLRTAKYQPTREELNAVLEQADGWLNSIQTELRNVSVTLRPTVLDDLGLIAALHSHFKRLEDSYHVRVQFSENVGGNRYTSDMETSFYRVCQEASLNACKYSGSSEIRVRLQDTEDYLTLEVTDEGAGFDLENPEIKGGGLGMPDMMDWAELVDGELTLQTAPGKGTSVWLTAPKRKVDSL